jgi:type IV pilus assembly protein PilB
VVLRSPTVGESWPQPPSDGYHRVVVFEASGQPPVGESGGSGEARRPLLGELLIQAKVVTAEQLAEALAAQREPVNDKKIGQVLIERGWMTEAQLTQTLSLQLSVPWVSLYHIDFSRQLLNRVERELAERYCLIPIFVRHVKGQGETLYVAMDDPTNDAALAEVSRQASLPARPMIASATDIRSAIRVYYGEPAGAQIIDVPSPPTRADPPTTTREGMRREPAPPTPPVPTMPDPPRSHPSQPPRAPSHPPPAPPAARRVPPVAPRAAADDADPPPPTTRSNPPPGRAAVLAAAANEGGIAPTAPRPAVAAAEPPAPVPRAEGSEPRRGRGKMISLTLLDGTTVQLPSAKGPKGPEGLTARDFVSALRATAHGADATEILGEQPQWEPVVAALLSILLRKGLIADWEFIEELRKI